LPLLAAEDPAAFDLRPDAVRRTGARLLRQMAAIAVGKPAPAAGAECVRAPRGGRSAASPLPIVATLAHGWRLAAPGAPGLLEAALILSADHELNVSAFTARCAASAGSTPYAVVQAGLAALSGFRHGGTSDRVELFLTEAQEVPEPRAAVGRWLRRGERVPGFGHPLYPDGDPRGRALLDAVARALPDAPGTRLSLALAEAGTALLGQHPTLDLGLAAVARALELPSGSALGLFALGRTIGWIGHALEQYADDRLIRPRARYVGPSPGG
jgi:citrate synthase